LVADNNNKVSREEMKLQLQNYLTRAEFYEYMDSFKTELRDEIGQLKKEIKNGYHNDSNNNKNSNYLPLINLQAFDKDHFKIILFIILIVVSFFTGLGLKGDLLGFLF